jgi:MoxR-like ATPase
MNGALDMAALLGSWVPESSGGLLWQDGVVTTMMRQRRGVVLIDEINMAIERNLARFYNLLDARREIVLYEHYGEVVRVPADEDSQFLVGAAYNPGYRGTRELSEALPNRFAFKMAFDYDPVIEAQLIPSDGIREVASRLRGMKREIRTPVSTNMLIEFCEIAMAFSTDYAVQNFVEAFPADGEAESVTQVMGLYRDRLATEIAALEAAYEQEGA